MNELYELMQIVKNSGQRGQELMIDSFVIGYLFGKKKIKNQEELQAFVEQLKEIKDQIDKGLEFPKYRDDFLLKQLGNLQSLVKDHNTLQQEIKKKENKLSKSKKSNLAQTTPTNPQVDLKDQTEQFQVEDSEKQQNQMAPKKSSKSQKVKEGVQTRKQIAQTKADELKNEQQKNELQKDEQQKNE